MTERLVSILASRVFRTGRQTLWRADDGHVYITLENRRNFTTYRVPPARVGAWRLALSGFDPDRPGSGRIEATGGPLPAAEARVHVDALPRVTTRERPPC